MSVNGLVHILGWGDFQMTQIDAITDPYPLYPKSDRQKVSKCKTGKTKKWKTEFVLSPVIFHPIKVQILAFSHLKFHWFFPNLACTLSQYFFFHPSPKTEKCNLKEKNIEN